MTNIETNTTIHVFVKPRVTVADDKIWIVCDKPDGDTIKKFMKSDHFFRGLRGPVGSGKSVACWIEIFRRALAQEPGPDGIRRTRMAIIRNTNPQLKTTTIKKKVCFVFFFI